MSFNGAIQQHSLGVLVKEKWKESAISLSQTCWPSVTGVYTLSVPPGQPQLVPVRDVLYNSPQMQKLTVILSIIFIYIQIQHICDNFLNYITYYQIMCLHSLFKAPIFDVPKMQAHNLLVYFIGKWF